MFYDRTEAGEKLAEKLLKYKNKPNTLILALVRGGIIVGEVVANKLHLSLDIIISKKIGAPGNSELAIGAVTESGDPVLNEEMIGTRGITAEYLDAEIFRVREEIKRRIKIYREGKLAKKLADKTIILVDDGVATGKTTEAAVKYLKDKKAKKIILAIPVIAFDTLEKLKKQVNELVYVEAPEMFFAVGQFYEEFPQITDEKVKKILSANY